VSCEVDSGGTSKVASITAGTGLTGGTTVASFSFTPARSGVVRVTSPTHCVQGQLTGVSEIATAAGTSEPDACGVSSARPGLMWLPGVISPPGAFTQGWTSERDFTVTAGAFTTVWHYACQSVGVEADARSGWFKVEEAIQYWSPRRACARRLFGEHGDRARKFGVPLTIVNGRACDADARVADCTQSRFRFLPRRGFA
jgi:hypothetical protein